MSRITAGDYEKLSAPFPVDDHKFRVLKKSKNGDTALWYAYVDARDVQARLSSVDLDWESKFRLLDMTGELAVVECELTVLGVTRCDVGTDDRNKIDGEGNYVKGAYSDALKRAAVNFGVGKYLYSLRNWYLPIDNFGNFTDDSLSKMRSALVSDLAKLGAFRGDGNNNHSNGNANGSSVNATKANTENGSGDGAQKRQASNGNGNGNGVQPKRQPASNGSNGNEAKTNATQSSNGSDDNSPQSLFQRYKAKASADGSAPLKDGMLKKFPVAINICIGERGNAWAETMSQILGYQVDPDDPQIPYVTGKELLDHVPETIGVKQPDGTWDNTVPNTKYKSAYASVVKYAWELAKQQQEVPFPV